MTQSSIQHLTENKFVQGNPSIECHMYRESRATQLFQTVLGKEIVRQESPEEPGKRSRLWFHEDVRHVLEENTGTNKIEGVLVDMHEQELIHLSPKVFKKMKSLRLFINRNVHFSRGPSYLSNELRLLDWSEYPSESLP
ncbi:hypothetical protein F2P56_013528 [Juglans regia]|uniref:Uncharacterized protein n=1 Tax=Juglans regia TaxID=51240 RepID=A0A833XP37_JUGRE|nr:hypothetical protein F2P56_013528 [Juglans regia]